MACSRSSGLGCVENQAGMPLRSDCGSIRCSISKNPAICEASYPALVAYSTASESASRSLSRLYFMKKSPIPTSARPERTGRPSTWGMISPICAACARLSCWAECRAVTWPISCPITPASSASLLSVARIPRVKKRWPPGAAKAFTTGESRISML